MKKLLLTLFLLTVFVQIHAQEELVKWTFPNNLLSDTVQNGTNPLNLTSTLRITGAGPITMTNGATTKAATATNWTDGMDSKYWSIRFKTAGYKQIKISYKQSAGGTNGGPKDFKLQFKIGVSSVWTDIPGGTVVLANNWTNGVVSDLELPAECQNQAGDIYIRWIMASNMDVLGGNVSAAGISKIDDIIVTGTLITGIATSGTGRFISYPNPSTSPFSVSLPGKTTCLEIFNSKGQLVYHIITENEIVRVEKSFPAGMYMIKATTGRDVKMIKHFVIQ